jgi:hypothetical protein
VGTKTITLVITLEVETADADNIDIRLGEVASPLVETATSKVPADVVEMIDEYAPPSMAPFQMDFAERCVAELDLDLQRPTGERKYVNGYPPKRFGAKRAAAFDVKSGRVEIYCRPENADGRHTAEVVTNNNEPFAVKVYLQSSDAVEQAIDLTRIGLEERGR